MTDSLTILQGDALEMLRTLPEASVHCCVTSPPYWGLRDYGVEGQIGLERTMGDYVSKMVEVFSEVRRVLRKDGTCWVNLGDCYNAYNGGSGPGSGFGPDIAQNTARPQLETGYGLRSPHLKPKDLCGIPWRVAFALQASGWWLRQDIIWAKPNPMPESVTDRCTKAHEYIFLLTKSERYWWDLEAMKEKADEPDRQRMDRIGGSNGHKVRHSPGAIVGASITRNRRSVWTIPTNPYPETHFATYPPDLIKPMILAGCPVGGTVLDPFAGSGTTGMVALELGRKAVLIELNPKHVELIRSRTNVTHGLPLSA